jgi:hypothetical protein
MKRALLIGVAIVAVLAAGLFGYGWWTRRSPVKYTRGGAFGATTSPSASPSVTGGPALGRYRYVGAGKERVDLGAVPACSWPVKDVTLTIASDPSGIVFDWALGKGRIEREIYAYARESVALSFSASTVTCFGVRTTTQDSYRPPAIRFRLPVALGQRWSTHAVTDNRTEDATVTVLGRERVTVPAGTYVAYVIEAKGTFTGSQRGTFETKQWYVPSLGVAAKMIQQTHATRAGATFTSEYTLDLAAGP